MKKIKLFLRNVKQGFATNSSSYHTAIILTEEEFQKWQQNEFTIRGLTKENMNNDVQDEDGMFCWVEDHTERFVDGKKIHAFSILYSSEY